METIIPILFIGFFVYVFGFHFRFSYGTKRIIHDELGYIVVTWWGQTRINNEQIEKEEDVRFWDLASHLDFSVFRTRSYISYQKKAIRVLTVKKGWFKHHLFPISKIKEKMIHDEEKN